MRRRAFIAALGGAAAWPSLIARAANSARHIGVLSALEAESAEVQERVAAFRERLAQLGWIEGQSLRIDYRWGGDAERRRESW